MPNKIWAILGIFLAVLAIVGAFIGYDQWRSEQSYNQGFDKCTANNVTAVNDAVAKDRKAEKDKQEKVDAQTEKQFSDLNDINDGLLNDIGKLRERAKRANRKQQADKSKSTCEGATGADLSASDAEFLTREAARADKIRIGLGACYDYADSITK